MNRNIIILGLCIALLVTTNVIGFAQSSEDGKGFVVALNAGELTMDPLHAFRTTELQITTGVYEGLVVYDPRSLRPMPGAAFRWEIDEGGKLYRFFLRRRAKFSNGDLVTAKDFRDSWLRILNPVDEGEYSFLFDVIYGAYEYRTGESDTSDDVGIRVVGDYVLEVELSRPASHFLSMLCHMTFAPIHSTYRNTEGWETFQPLITNGPYSLESWDSSGMKLARNIHYWDAWNITMPDIRIDFGYTPQTASVALNNGTLHWALLADAATLENRELIQVAPLFATSYLYFRSEQPPWTDFRVRKGLARLVPWNTIREEMTSFGTSTLVPALGFYPRVDGLSGEDVEAGLELLATAGFPQGKGLPAISILVIPGSVAEATAGELKNIWERHLDVAVEIVRVSFQDYQREVQKGGFTMGSSTWIGDFADPLAFLQMWMATSKLNDARYRDDTYDDLVSTAMGESGERRFEILSNAERRLLTDEVVVIPLSHTISVNFIDLKLVGGWRSNALDVHPFKNIFFKTPAAPRWHARSTGTDGPSSFDIEGEDS